MRVLLAGASGAIGRYLIPQLIAAGHTVVGTTRVSGALASTGAAELVTNVDCRADFLKRVEGLEFDAVVHQLSALSRTAMSYADMTATNRLRSEGTSTLVAAARLTGATKFIYPSSVFGYGLRDHGSRVLDESSPFGQLPGTRLDAMQKALLSGEQQARAFGGVALRYGVFYRGRGPIPAVVDGWNGMLPFVHLHDAASATVLALHKGVVGSVYNVVDDTPASWREVHEARSDTFGVPSPVVQPLWFTRVRSQMGAHIVGETSLKVSNARAKAELHWQPAYPSYRDALAADASLVHHAQAVLAGKAQIVR